MADETETPSEVQKPPRRRAPRASSRTKADAVKPEPASAEAAPRRAARKSTATADADAKPAAKPAPAKRAPAKPRAAKRQTPATKRRKSDATTAEKAIDKVGGKWSAAAIAGGVAAVGAAAAALLTLRGSNRTKSAEPGSTGSTTPVPLKPAVPSGAHTADGSDAAKSFAPGSADENSIPDA